MRRVFVVWLLAFLFPCWLAPRAEAVLVDWDTLGWTPGTLTSSFDVDPGNPGTDVTFAVSGNIGTMTTDQTGGIFTPAITMSLAGGQTPVEKSLELAANLHTTSKITFTATFSSQYVKAVTFVSFTIFDIDTDAQKELVKNIYGIAPDGTHVAATITLGPAVNRTGNGLGQTLSGTVDSPETGPGSDAGNAIISFGNNVITGFAFTWSNNAGAPRYQNISVSDILFSPVPEFNPEMIAALFVLLVIFSRAWPNFLRKSGDLSTIRWHNSTRSLGDKALQSSVLRDNRGHDSCSNEREIRMPTTHWSIRVGASPSARNRGFTVVEVMAGVSILGLVVGVVFFGLMQLNNYASVNRLYTAAQTLAQNQIDLILTKAPYDPSNNSFPTPNVLQTGGYYSDPSTPNTLYNGARNVPIYTDPSNNNQVVVGTIRTDISTPPFSVGGTSLNIRQATVTVQYTFRRTTYTVKMDTMRAPDV